MVKARRSYRAILLSIILPGMAQIYLRKPLKGIIILLGIISAITLIYLNSLPVHSWQDLIRLDRTETLSGERSAKEQTEPYPETDDSESGDKDPRQWRGYPLYTSDSKFMFRITEDVESHLVDSKELSTELVREFRKHKVLVYKGATVSTKKEGSWWLIDDYYQTYSVRKSEYGLDVYSTAQWRFRPRWQFKITGMIQLLIFWGYAVIDGWLGRRQE